MKIKDKKGFTFFLVAFAALAFLALLIIFWIFMVPEAGESEVVTSYCGRDAEYCETTPELKLLGYLKMPVEYQEETYNLADLIVYHTLNPSKFPLKQLKEYTSVFSETCIYTIKKEKETIEIKEITGNIKCEPKKVAIPRVKVTLYIKEDTRIELAEGFEKSPDPDEIAAYDVDFGYSSI